MLLGPQAAEGCGLRRGPKGRPLATQHGSSEPTEWGWLPRQPHDRAGWACRHHLGVRGEFPAASPRPWPSLHVALNAGSLVPELFIR